METSLTAKLGGVDAKLGGLETSLTAKLGGVDAKLDGLETKIDRVKTGLSAELKAMRKELNFIGWALIVLIAEALILLALVSFLLGLTLA